MTNLSGYATPAPAAGYASPPQQAPARVGMNGAAVFALVTGLLGLSPVAIALGHIAIVQVRRRRQKGLVLAIIGLALGYLGLIAEIVAILWLVSYVSTGPTPPTSF